MFDVRFYPCLETKIDYYTMPFCRNDELTELDLQAGYMKFSGHWYIDNEKVLPEILIFRNKEDYYLIKITEHNKTRDEANEGSFYDEDVGGYITLFPQYITELKFELIEELSHDAVKKHLGY